MTYGFTVTNANGEVTVSDIQFNPYYVGQATFQPPAGSYFWTTGGSPFVSGTGTRRTSVFGITTLFFALARYRITFPTAQGNPLPFIIQDERVVYGASINAIELVSSSNGNSTWDIILNICNSRSNDIAGQPRVIVFSMLPPNTTPTGYGLFLKSESPSPYPGQVVFNSNFKHLFPEKILTYSTSTAVNTTDPYGNGFTIESYNSRSALGVSIALPAFFYQSDLMNVTYAYGSLRYMCAGVARINGGYFETSIGAFPWTPSSVPYYDKPRGNEPVIIIDANKYL